MHEQVDYALPIRPVAIQYRTRRIDFPRVTPNRSPEASCGRARYPDCHRCSAGSRKEGRHRQPHQPIQCRIWAAARPPGRQSLPAASRASKPPGTAAQPNGQVREFRQSPVPPNSLLPSHRLKQIFSLRRSSIPIVSNIIKSGSDLPRLRSQRQSIIHLDDAMSICHALACIARE